MFTDWTPDELEDIRLAGQLDPTPMTYGDLSHLLSPLNMELVPDHLLDFGDYMDFGEHEPVPPYTVMDVGPNSLPEQTCTVIPCDPSIAGISYVHVEDAIDLATSGIYGASALGYGNFLDRLVARSVLVRPSPQESLRALLREMMEHGVPLLVGTGNKNGGKVSDRAAAEAVTTENFNSFSVKHFGVGSLFVVMDSAMNVICVVRPMAVPWLAPQGTTGYLPEEFRNPLYPSTSSVQFFCEIQCVAAWPQMACATWKLDPRFNFGVDKRDPLAGYKDMRRQGTHLIVNRRCFTTRLFQDYPLAALDDVLGDFVGKLRNFQGAPNKQTLKGDPNHVDKDYCMWRRALLLKMLFETNEGTVSRCLSEHLPVSIVGEPARVSERCANAIKATDFTIAFTRVKVSAMLAHLGFDLQ